MPKVEGPEAEKGSHLPVKRLRCLRSAQKACSGGSSVAWRLGDVPASDSRAELGVGTERTAGVELLHLAMLLRCLVEAGMR